MPKLTDVTGKSRHVGTRSSVPTTDATGKRDASVADIVSMDDSAETSAVETFDKARLPDPFVQGNPMKPDPKIFKFTKDIPEPQAEEEAPRKPRSMSEIVKAVRERPHEGDFGNISKASFPDQRERARRLTHNEMLEQIVGSNVSNQTKFYVIAQLGYHEESPKESRESESRPSFAPKLTKAPLGKVKSKAEVDTME